MIPNINNKTGIRYGVISLDSVNPNFLDEFDAIYNSSDIDDDYAEPVKYIYDKDGIKCEYDADSSMNILFVFESPVITTCSLCSPCVPNAGDLDSPNEHGFDCYGLPSDCLNSEAYEQSN